MHADTDSVDSPAGRRQQARVMSSSAPRATAAFERLHRTLVQLEEAHKAAALDQQRR